MNPGGGWPTTGTSPFLPISHIGADSKDLIGWYSVRNSGDMAEKTEYSFVNNE